MSDSAVASAPAPAQVGSPKKPSKAAAASKKPRVKPAHPPTSEMVIAAIKNLKERGGSSLQAIKKYITTNYKVDAEKLAPFIKKYLKSAVTSGSLVQTKGKGASGSFKLKSAEKGESKKAPAAVSGKKPAAKKLTKKPVAAGKAAKPKKAAAAKPSTPKAKKPKSPSKAKKTSAKGSPTKKPKAPKPKKATAKPKAAAKKAAPKKK